MGKDKEKVVRLSGKNIIVCNDEKEDVVVLELVNAARVSFAADTALEVGANLIAASYDLHQDKEQFAEKLVDITDDMDLVLTGERMASFSVGVHDNNVTMSLGDGEWVGVSTTDARRIANTLLDHANDIDKTKNVN